MSVREELVEWLVAQDLWQQDLARRLVGRTQLEGDDYAQALAMVKTAHSALAEQDERVEPQPLQLDDVPVESVGRAPRLVRFGRLRGVGAVSDDQELSFEAHGITVVYGQNAAGKTTYVRALKQVCRTVDCEAAVRGNVFDADGSATPPSATVEFSVGGDLRAQRLDLDKPPELGLEAISVFDTRCAELYLDAQNAVAYVPSGLRLLARLAATQDQMRSDLQNEVRQLQSQAPTFLEFTPGTPVRAFLDGLSASTPPHAAEALAELSEEEQARLTELRAVVASAAARSVRVDAASARQDVTQARALAQQLRALNEPLAPDAIVRLRGLAAELSAARAAVQLAVQQFSNLPVGGIGSEPWRLLWDAARNFAEAIEDSFPPEAGHHCPLCLQVMSDDAASRMGHFESHVRSATESQARAAQDALDSALVTLQPGHVDASRTPFYRGLAEREADLYQQLDDYLAGVASAREALLADPAGAEVAAVGLDAVRALDRWADDREAHAVTLEAVDDPTREAELQAELSSLDARVALGTRLDDVEEARRVAVTVAALERARSSMATNRLTTKQRELSEEVVAGALDAMLNEELRELRCDHLPVNLHPQTSVGETQVRLRLAGAHGAPQVSEVASEGEQRAVALSFFFAEVATSDSDGGIVVDDPVSSLDDERRAHIAARLVAEASRRQVIVFTHDLPFMLDLVDRAEGAGAPLSVQAVWRMGTQVGRVDDHPPFKAMKLRARVGVLTQEVAQWDNQPEPRDFDDAWRRVCDFYARLRMCWERAVEERLFQGVVQRFQRDVKTRALKDINITAESLQVIDTGMTRCSQFVHDNPPAAGTHLPGRTELAQDLAELQAYEKQTR